MDELNTLSLLLIEHETIDKDQFERLLAGEDVASIFPEEVPPVTPPASEAPEKKPSLRPSPRTIPGAAMQPPPTAEA
jgi:hypothetical protein